MRLQTGRTYDPRRWVAFSVAGILGVGVQALVLMLLTTYAGWFYLPATALAVEVAVLHNFLWHERWTWAARAMRAPGARLRRWWRFNLGNGAVSILGNLTLTAVFVTVAHLPVVPANLLAIASTSIANYLVADRWVFDAGRSGTFPISRPGAVVTLAALCVWPAAPASATYLKPETVAAWNRYVAETEWRLDRDELSDSRGLTAPSVQ